MKLNNNIKLKRSEKVFSLLFLVFFTLGMGKVEAQHVLNLPKVFDAPDGTTLDGTGDKIQTQAWVVWSDRNDNLTYTEKAGSTVKEKMGFMDAFFVTDEVGDYVHLYSYTGAASGTGKRLSVPQGSKDFGWVNKDHLLLWSHCLLNDKHLSRKALSVINEKTLTGDLTAYLAEGSLLKIFTDPGLTTDNKDQRVAMFHYLFIYKADEKNHSFLLGKPFKTSAYGIKSQKDILGWVNTDILTEWGDRVCLQPNTDPKAIAERKDLKIKSMLFKTKEQAQNWMTAGETTGKLWAKDSFQQTFTPYWTRFPILSNNDGIVETGTTTDIVNKSGGMLVSEEEHRKVEAANSRSLLKLRTVNIVFVVDGSTDYQVYLKKVSDIVKWKAANIQAIKDAGASGGNLENFSNYSFGAVLYRDQGDVNCPGGGRAIDKFDLNSNPENLVAWLQQHTATAGCKEGHKAVIDGLAEAQRMIKVTGGDDAATESNFIVLIGGEIGPESTPGSDDALARSIASTNTNLLAFQVASGNSDGFEEFVSRIIGIVKTASKTRYDQNNEKFKNYYVIEAVPHFAPAGDNSYKTNYPQGSPFQGIVTFADKGQQLLADTVERQVEDQLDFDDKDIEHKVAVFTSKFEGQGEKKVQLDESMLAILEAMGKSGISQEVLSKYKNDAFQFFVKGYVAENNNRLSNPAFSRVLFLHEDEFEELVAKLRVLAPEEGAEKMRENVKNGYFQVVANFLGDRELKNKFDKNEVTLEDVNALITNVKSKNVNNPLLKYKISDLDHKDIVSNDKIEEIRDYMLDKVNKLRNSITDAVTVTYEWGRFYWIDEKLMP